MAETTVASEIGFEGNLAYIQIDYATASDDPARVFRAMAKLIEAFYEVDRDLARAVSTTIEPVLVLERIEAGSLRAWLRTVLRQLDDDALHNLDWKPLVGQYLVRGKHALLRWLDDHNTVTSRSDVVELQRELQSLTPAPEDLGSLVASAVSVRDLLEGARLITDALGELSETDSVAYVSVEGVTPIDTGLHLSEEDVELLLTEEVVSGEAVLVLLVKRPDYLGNARWEFRHDQHSFEAKILDDLWLESFRRGDFSLRPGDALRAIVRSELYRGFEGNVVGARHFIVRVLGIVRADEADQFRLPGA